MAASFQQLSPILQTFEHAHFSSLGSPASGIPHLHGGVQFASIEPATSTARATRKSYAAFEPGDEAEKLVVAAVGVNYTQQKTDVTYPGSFHPYLTIPSSYPSSGTPTIIDYAPQMRREVDRVLMAYQRNSSHWSTHASGVPKPLISGAADYILIATNLCPFITTKGWSRIGSRDDRAIRGAWCHKTHLNPLFSKLDPFVDLWIGHWPSHWPIFDSWRNSMGISRWMLSHNLSAPGGLAYRTPGHRLFPLYRSKTQNILP